MSACVGLSRVCKKPKDASEAKLKPPAAISLIGRRGQQRSIDGSITLSIWWPNRAGLAWQTHSPSLCLSYCVCRNGLTLTQENLSHHLCWFMPGMRCPVNPFDQPTWTILMQEDLYRQWRHGGKIRVLTSEVPPTPKYWIKSKNHFLLKRFTSTSGHPTLKPERATCDPSQNAVSIENEISASVFGGPSPRPWRSVRRSAYLYLRPLMMERVHRLLSSDATLPLNLPNPPPGQNTSTPSNGAVKRSKVNVDDLTLLHPC